jgi:Sec-independent protein translocase protein TatA
MFGLSKFQILVIVILGVLVFHQRKVYESVVVDAEKFLTKEA